MMELSIRIHLVYVKAHTGITGNEMADQYSKKLAHKILKGDISAPVTMSISDAFRIASDKLTDSWQLYWDNHDKARYTYNLIPSVQTKINFPKIRDIGVSYCRLLLHDSMLRYDSHRIGTSDTPYCEYCSVNKTSEHFLLQCSLYDRPRSVMMDYLKDNGVFAKLKGRISESHLLASICDNLSNKDNNKLKEALFQFLCQVNRTI